jgi:hypothetical protein
LEEKKGWREPVNYIIAGRLYNPVQKKISPQRTWLKLDDGIEMGETQLSLSDYQFDVACPTSMESI